MNFCDGDQLDGLALLKDASTGSQHGTVFLNAPLGGQRDVLQGEIHNGVYRGILIPEEVFPSGFGKQLLGAVEVVWGHKLKQAVLPHDDQLDKVLQLPLPLAGGACLVASPRARTAPASARARTQVASPGLLGFALGATAG